MKAKSKPYPEFDPVPLLANDADLLYSISGNTINGSFLSRFRELADLTDEVISNLLHISVRTYRTYRDKAIQLSDDLKERVLLLAALFKKGNEVFGSSEAFQQWLSTENFFFDQRSPLNYLNTITGIRFVESRLRAMELGDNV